MSEEEKSINPGIEIESQDPAKKRYVKAKRSLTKLSEIFYTKKSFFRMERAFRLFIRFCSPLLSSRPTRPSRLCSVSIRCSRCALPRSSLLYCVPRGEVCGGCFLPRRKQNFFVEKKVDGGGSLFCTLCSLWGLSSLYPPHHG